MSYLATQDSTGEEEVAAGLRNITFLVSIGQSSHKPSPDLGREDRSKAGAVHTYREDGLTGDIPVG